jgi:hypothetical protein
MPLLKISYTEVMFVGGDCPSQAATLSISASSRLKDSLFSADIFWYAVLASLFFCYLARPQYGVGLSDMSRLILACV